MGTGRGWALASGGMEAPFHFESKDRTGVSGCRYSGQPYDSKESSRAKTNGFIEGVNSAWPCGLGASRQGLKSAS